MANLTALHFENGTWDVFVTEGVVHGVLDRSMVANDVLGRKLPQYERLEALTLVKQSQAVRLANHLKGLSRDRRQQIFRDWSAGAQTLSMDS